MQFADRQFLHIRRQVARLRLPYAEGASGVDRDL
jgi:hypothetical protein